MAKARLHIWHNLNGEIVAIGRPMSGDKCVPVSGEGESILEAEIEEELIAGLHRTHVVDVHRKCVVKQESSAKRY
jgi:hypothetical protein